MKAPVPASPWIRGRFLWLGRVLQHPDIPDVAKLLAAALVNDFVSRNTGDCRQSWRTLAAYLGRSDYAIRRAAAELEEAHFLKIERGAGRANNVHVLSLRMPQAAGAGITGARPTESRAVEHDFQSESRALETESRALEHAPPAPPNKDNLGSSSERARDPREEFKRGAIRLWLDGRNSAGSAAITPERLRAMVEDGACTAAEAQRALRAACPSPQPQTGTRDAEAEHGLQPSTAGSQALCRG